VIDPTVGQPAEHQRRIGLVDALDARPAVVRIGLPQIRQIEVDRVGVDIDEPWAGGPITVDGVAPYVRRDGVDPF
jgi:hypothetical protein